MRSVPSKVVFGSENAYGTFNKYIEDIRIGDMVLAIDERTGQQSYKPVKQLFVRTAPRIYNIHYEDGTVINTTWSHPFYIKRSDVLSKARMFMVSFSGDNDSSTATMTKMTGLENGQWVDAKDIRAGDVSITTSGKDLRVVKVSVDSNPDTVYNFTVDEHHNYYVGESGVLVHNEAYGEISKYLDEQLADPFSDKIDEIGKAIGKESQIFMEEGEELRNTIIELSKTPEGRQFLLDAGIDIAIAIGNPVTTHCDEVTGACYGMIDLGMGIPGKIANVTQKLSKVKRFFNVVKSESKIWKGLKNYKKNVKSIGTGRKKTYHQWDHKHNDIEVYDSNFKHLGSMDPQTGLIYKKAVKGRTLKLD